MIEQAKKNRRPVPDKIMNAPVLFPGLAFYYAAFMTLSSCRPVGMAEGRIPWTVVKDYALHYGLDDEEFDILWELITRVDAAYLAWQNKRSSKKEPVSTRSEEVVAPKAPRIIHTAKR